MENTIAVDREKLLKVLVANRKMHQLTYKKATKAYRKAVLKALRKQVKTIESGGKIDQHVLGRLPEPRHYLSEYDTAISMVKWQTEDTYPLDQNTFENWVLDKWGWKGNFLAGTSAYV